MPANDVAAGTVRDIVQDARYAAAEPYGYHLNLKQRTASRARRCGRRAGDRPPRARRR